MRRWTERLIPPGQKEGVAREFWRFFVVGVGNYLLTYAVYLALIRVVSPEASIVLSALVGLAFTSALNISVVFKKKFRTTTVVSYSIYYVLYLFLYAAVLRINIHLGVPVEFAPFPTACIMVPLHFICSRAIITATVRDSGDV